MSQIEENALLLLREIRIALARGTKHYAQDGRLLTTPQEIIDCLLAEGGVDLEPASSTDGC
jgi:hypothetical protein